MNTAIFILIIIILLSVLILTLYLLFSVVNKLRPFKSKDANIKQAHVYATWGASVILIVLFLGIVGGIFLGLTIGWDIALIMKFSSGFTTIIFVVTILFFIFMNILTGVLAALSAKQIGESSLDNDDNPEIQTAKSRSVWASVLSISVPILIIISLAIFYFKNNKLKNKNQED